VTPVVQPLSCVAVQTAACQNAGVIELATWWRQANQAEESCNDRLQREDMMGIIKLRHGCWTCGLFTTLLCAAVGRAGAQPIEAGDRIIVKSAVLKEDRTIYVRVPRQGGSHAVAPVR
jgi:hypothetical protein